MLMSSYSGLSGSTVAEIEAVPPEFIQEAQIGQSLTPGRNNGFLNMLAVMKKKAATIRNEAAAASSGGTTTSSSSSSLDNTSSSGAAAGGSASNDDDDNNNSGGGDSRPMYNGIIAALQVLKPTKLVLVDNSAQHAGHAGSKGFNGESHFELQIVADAFEGLNLVKRHKLVYMLLGDIMPKIHALQISAKTPKEVE
jgi:BolA-like protein 1